MSVKVHEPVCMDSPQDLYFWFDHFLGDQVKDEWNVVGTGTSVVVDAQTGGIMRSTTGAVDTNIQYIYWANIRSLHVGKKVTFEARVKINQSTFIQCEIMLFFDWNNFINFFVNENAGGATNWFIRCKDGVQTSVDSGIALDTNYRVFRIEAHTHGSNHVHFYIDGMETAFSPITTNIPDDAGDFLQPYLRVVTNEDATKSIDVDYVVVRQER